MNETENPIASEVTPTKPNSIRCKFGSHKKIYVQEHRINGEPFDKKCVRCGKDFDVLYLITLM